MPMITQLIFEWPKWFSIAFKLRKGILKDLIITKLTIPDKKINAYYASLAAIFHCSTIWNLCCSIQQFKPNQSEFVYNLS